MLYNKYNFIIHDFCDKSEIRPEISGVFVSPKESVATNSFILAKVSKSIGELNDYPIIPNKGKPLSNFQSFIIPKDKAKEVADMIKKNKKNEGLPILNNAIVMSVKNNMAEIGITDLNSYNSVQTRVIEGKYPEYNEIVAEKGRFNEIEVNPEFLLKIAKFYKEFGEKENIKSIKIKVPFEKDAPIRFFAKNNEGQTAVVLLMPLKSN